LCVMIIICPVGKVWIYAAQMDLFEQGSIHKKGVK